MSNSYIDLAVEGGTGGVTSLNGLVGALTLVAGSNITITPSGSNITIASTGGGSSITLGAFDGQSPTANGLALVSSVLYAQSATPSFPGMVNLVQQTFAGNKTFASIGINDTSASAGLFISSPAIGTPSQITKAISGQTAPLLELINSTGVTQVQFTAAGNWQMYNTVATPEARIDFRPSVELATINVGASARYSMFIGDPNSPEVAGQGGGIALGGVMDGAGTATEFGYIWATKNNNTSGNIDGSMHFATRNNASGLAERVLDMDQNGNSFFWGTLALQGSTSGNFTQQVPATVTSYTVTWPAAQGAAATVPVNNGSGVLSWTAFPSPYSVSSINSNTASVSGTTYLCDTSGAAFTVTLPVPVSGAFIAIKDSTGSFQTNNLTIAQHSGEKIEGLAASKLLETNWGAWAFFSNGTDWFMGPF
jgi:hypothetical protein